MTLIVGPLRYSKTLYAVFFFLKKCFFSKLPVSWALIFRIASGQRVQLHVGKLYYFVRQERVIPFYAFSYT